MMTMYVKTGCPFCAMVLRALDEHEVSYEEKNIADDAVAAELVEIGGKRQVPYMVDHDRGVSMYESSDIVAYINEHYGADAENTADEG